LKELIIRGVTTLSAGQIQWNPVLPEEAIQGLPDNGNIQTYDRELEQAVQLIVVEMNQLTEVEMDKEILK
jgi:hypothetical protein